MPAAALRAALLCVVVGSTMGCLLPEFENGPAPAASEPSDASAPSDAMQDGSPLPDAADEPDAIDEPDALQLDVISPDAFETGPEFCELNPDGTPCGAGDACYELLCEGGTCVTYELADGTVCDAAPNACWKAGTCENGVCGTATVRADGYNWDASDTWKRCCGGEAVRMDTNANCGVCGIQCDTSDGQSCKLNSANGKYYCEDCHASARCWSGCCSTSYGQPYRCAASDCSGNCITCPSGSSCVQSPGVASLVCAYE